MKRILKYFSVVLILGCILCSCMSLSKSTKKNKIMQTETNKNNRIEQQITKQFSKQAQKNIEQMNLDIDKIKQKTEKKKETKGFGVHNKLPEDFLLEEMVRQKYKYIIDQLLEIREHERIVMRINVYYAQRNSPMEGTGEFFYKEFKRTGINPYLSVAISEGESSCGLACFAPYNAWGMLAYPRGFNSWEEGITANFNWLQMYFGCPQTAYDCPGYCEPPQPWMDNVDGIRKYIQSMEVDHLLSPRSGNVKQVLPKDKIIACVYAQLGKPYCWGAKGPSSFDCSGLVYYCYSAAGVQLPRTSHDQMNCGVPRQLNQLAAGDIVGFNDWNHVGIYIGNGNYIHASHSGSVVQIDSLSKRGDFCGARQLF